ncbi:MAG: hydrogenase iron-sulfur subunit [Deltaproteobacteria bacterium]|nr:hydrogenase iron-sulfur subunit [Deltaproteobacteria bacterium]
MSEFQPKVVAFLCNWCSYSAADAAGSARKTHPAGVKVVRLMCSGRMDPQLVVQAFAAGADGVMILGCHPGDCHYREGNYKARRRYALLSRMLEQLGIDRRRLVLDWVSAAESDKFVEVTNEMVESLRLLGPLVRVGPCEQEVA